MKFAKTEKHAAVRTEAVVWKCFVKMVFLQIWHNLQENTCFGVSFNKVSSVRPAVTNETPAQMFSCEFSCKKMAAALIPTQN